MTCWIPSSDTLPTEAGWYPTLSDWRTSSLHPGSRRWLGTKWAAGAPERIAFYCPEAFAEPEEAASRAFTLETSGRMAGNSNEDVEVVRLAAAAG